MMPKTPSSGSINWPKWLTEFREILIFTSLSKDMRKDIDEHSDEEIHRMISEKVANSGASVPAVLGCVTLPECGCIHPPGNSPNPVL